ncbi:hypothetical protein [Arthrobacter woluwensis]|uniref:hypothetical protein n=1 Tax=Arthrobacter woluwensis TaxID=156980 RepID=UPI0011A0E266|nr:hypothetical protein [Arthrobacter woluwensis]
MFGFFPVVVAEKDTGILELPAPWCLLGSIYAVIILFRLSREARVIPPASGRFRPRRDRCCVGPA